MGKRQNRNGGGNNQNKPQQQKNQKPQQTVSAPKITTLTLNRRNELNALIADLLKLGIKTASTNSNEEWQLYVEIQVLLARIQQLELPLKRPYQKTTHAERLTSIETFYKWANENGLKYRGLEISEFSGYDLGLKATRDISVDEELFVIPRKLILSEESVKSEFNTPQFSQMSNLNLSYALMWESVKADSFWKPYFNLLPDKYSNVLYFSIDQMGEMRGSNLFPEMLRLCKAIARQYAFIYNYTQSLPSFTITPDGLRFKEQFSYDLYRWAVSTVMTRENLIPSTAAASSEPCLKSETVAALIPFWDMANHQYGSVTSFYNLATHQMESAAQTDFKQGEQIFIHYGDRSNGHFMVHNGFINVDNPKDFVNIILGLSPSEPMYRLRLHLLDLLNIQKNGELKVLPAPDYISPELLAYVRVFNMNDKQLRHWSNSDRAMDLLHIDCALETSLESKTWQYLQTRLMLLLRACPTTLEHDEERLATLHSGELKLSYIDTMVLEYRVLEKRILTAALDYAKQRTKA